MRYLRGRTLDLEIALGLALSSWLLYRPVLRLWWTYDDFYHLRHLITGRAWWYLFDGAEYRTLEAKVLTPFLFLSLDLDRRLFGLDPHAFYLHQLLSLSLAPAALYGALRIWLGRLAAAAGSWVFLLGPATAALAPLLFVRHYIEAILLGTLAVAAWAGALRRDGGGAWRIAGISALLYLAASLAKEIAVPLIAILPWLPTPEGGPRRSLEDRLFLLLPHAAALAVYLSVRYAWLDTLGGGYGFEVACGDLPRLALALPGRIAAELLGGRLTLAGALFGLALAAVLVLALGRAGRALALTGAALLLALLPILPVSVKVEPRFAAASWVVLAAAFAAGCQALMERDRRLGVPLGVAAALLGLILNRQDWRDRYAHAERMSAEDRFVAEMGEGDALRHPLLLAASLGELQWMKRNVLNHPLGGRWFQDDLYLCAHPEPAARVWGYDPDRHRVLDITDRIPQIRDRYCSAIRWKAPLSAAFRFSESVLRWRLGPYEEGGYAFLLGDGAAAFAMPRRAGFHLKERAPFLRLRVKYEAPEGWVTYSPELQVPLVEGEGVRWGRGRSAR